MINSICQRSDNLIEIKLEEKSDYISCKVMYSIDNNNWYAASIYPGIDSNFILNGCDLLWIQAQEDGIVRLHNKVDSTIYWNYILNIPGYTGHLYLKVMFLIEKELYEDIKEIDIVDKGVIYLSDWKLYLGENASSNPSENEDKWQIVNSKPFDFVKMKHKKKLPPINIPVCTSVKEGYYDIYIGTKSGSAEFLIRTGNNNPERIITGGTSMSLYKSNYAGKSNKEIYWKRELLGTESNNNIEISQLQETYNSFQDMGSISYVKLVPVEEKNDYEISCKNNDFDKKNRQTNMKGFFTDDIILYYEPYSYTLHGIHDGDSMNRIMLEEFIRLNPSEITCQTMRIGSKCLHNSKFIEKFDKAARTDENTIIDDPIKLAQNCDILEETVKYIKQRKDAYSNNIKLTANIGMNRPYLRLPEISEKFTTENPVLLKGGYFDYTKPEVQEYAIRIIYEFIDEYDIDGMFFDYMRSYNNQTVESIIYIIKTTKERLNQKAARVGKNLELKARIPADQIVYYQAMKVCIENGYIDGVVPSNLVTSEPLPPVKHYLELAKDTKTKVYGCIDGWKYTMGSDPRAGALEMANTPDDIEKYFKHYENEGVDGIFIYQADQFSANPYINKLFLI